MFMMRYKELYVSISILLILVPIVSASCVTLEDLAAIEVVFNKPGAVLDYSRLVEAGYAVRLSSQDVAYRSGYDARIVVILGDTYLGGKYGYMRIQVPFVNGKALYNVSDAEARRVLQKEAERLLEMGVLRGVSREDIEAIVSCARLGYAGWDTRIVYEDGYWKPFNQTRLYRPLSACTVPLTFNLEDVPVFPAGGESFPSTTIVVAVVLAGLLLAGFLLYRQRRASKTA
jgi:hypothetical protein